MLVLRFLKKPPGIYRKGKKYNMAVWEACATIRGRLCEKGNICCDHC
jgi:hypothetical protein